MDLPDRVAIKLDTYTLFCRQLLEHLQPLKDAVREDSRLDCEQCYGYLNSELADFFQEADPVDLRRASEQLGEGLLSHVGYIEDRNSDAVAVFEQVAETACEEVSTWRHQNDLRLLHQQGRQMAQQFYRESPWQVTQDRLDREAQLVICYDRGTPLAFRPNYPVEHSEQGFREAILLRFTFDCSFEQYLTYPYLFMHEYVAHIFACDYKNERFNDGWLLHSANRFVARKGWDLDVDPPLVREQISAFGEKLYGSLGRTPRLACRFARQFDDWMADPDRFQEMTWELAAFEPRENESVFWADMFLNRLEQAFEHDRELLRRKIDATSGARDLFEILATV